MQAGTSITHVGMMYIFFVSTHPFVVSSVLKSEVVNLHAVCLNIRHAPCHFFKDSGIGKIPLNVCWQRSRAYCNTFILERNVHSYSYADLN